MCSWSERAWPDWRREPPPPRPGQRRSSLTPTCRAAAPGSAKGMALCSTGGSCPLQGRGGVGSPAQPGDRTAGQLAATRSVPGPCWRRAPPPADEPRIAATHHAPRPEGQGGVCGVPGATAPAASATARRRPGVAVDRRRRLGARGRRRRQCAGPPDHVRLGHEHVCRRCRSRPVAACRERGPIR